jgi:hypothetical protein
MASTVIIRWAGMPGDEATALYDRVHDGLMGLVDSGKYPGLIFHSCSKAEHGMVVVDVWEDVAAFQGLFADPAAIAAFELAGVPEPTSVEVLETHNVERR